MAAYLVLTAPESFNLIETQLNRAMNDSQKNKPPKNWTLQDNQGIKQ